MPHGYNLRKRKAPPPEPFTTAKPDKNMLNGFKKVNAALRKNRKNAKTLKLKDEHIENLTVALNIAQEYAKSFSELKGTGDRMIKQLRNTISNKDATIDLYKDLGENHRIMFEKVNESNQKIRENIEIVVATSTINRERYLEYARKYRDGETVRHWKRCEMCDKEYGWGAMQVPRVLSCGHTLCTACIRRLTFNHGEPHFSIRCPFDTKETPVDCIHEIETKLPVNRLALLE